VICYVFRYYAAYAAASALFSFFAALCQQERRALRAHGCCAMPYAPMSPFSYASPYRNIQESHRCAIRAHERYRRRYASYHLQRDER